MGLKSGGITGSTSNIIQSGLLPDWMNASTTSRRLIILTLFCPVLSSSFALSSMDSSSSLISLRSFFTASAPMPALKPLPYFSLFSRYSLSVNSCFDVRDVFPPSRTTYEAKYSIFSNDLGDMSSKMPILLGIPLKYQMWDTGAANSI